jgi:hypothetical protein
MPHDIAGRPIYEDTRNPEAKIIAHGRWSIPLLWFTAFSPFDLSVRFRAQTGEGSEDGRADGNIIVYATLVLETTLGLARQRVAQRRDIILSNVPEVDAAAYDEWACLFDVAHDALGYEEYAGIYIDGGSVAGESWRPGDPAYLTHVSSWHEVLTMIVETVASTQDTDWDYLRDTFLLLPETRRQSHLRGHPITRAELRGFTYEDALHWTR